MEDYSRYDSLAQQTAQKMNDTEFAKLESEQRPFIITSVVGTDFCNWWTHEALRKMDGEKVYFVNGDAVTASRTLMESTFPVFVDESKRFSDRANFAYMNTNLDAAPDLVQFIRTNIPDSVPSGHKNLFRLWPKAFRPAAFSLLVGGHGARTNFSCDGMNAGQWHLCLAGHMRFKMIPHDAKRFECLDPRPEPVGILDARREPIFEICRRLSSKIDLFQTEFIGSTPSSHLDSYGPDFHRWPNARDLPRALEVLLKPGEMLVVPGNWWIQRYMDEPSWVVNESFLSSTKLDSVLLDVLQHNGFEPSNVPQFSGLTPEQRVDVTFIMVLGSKGDDGSKLLSMLRESEKPENTASLPSETTAGTASCTNSSNCAVCGRPAKTQCGRCKKYSLCGAECQRRSWPEHRKVCIKAR